MLVLGKNKSFHSTTTAMSLRFSAESQVRVDRVDSKITGVCSSEYTWHQVSTKEYRGLQLQVLVELIWYQKVPKVIKASISLEHQKVALALVIFWSDL